MKQTNKQTNDKRGYVRPYVIPSPHSDYEVSVGAAPAGVTIIEK